HNIDQKTKTDADWPPLFLETMEHVTHSVVGSEADLRPPGCTTDREPEFLSGMLPAFYSARTAFTGAHPYYGDVLTVFSNEDPNMLGDMICLTNNTMGISLKDMLTWTPSTP